MSFHFVNSQNIVARCRLDPLAFRIGRASLAVIGGCLAASCVPFTAQSAQKSGMLRAIELHDTARSRTIPILLYGVADGNARSLAVIAPGYGIGHNEYSFIARELVAQGFVVAAIQIQLSSDPLVPGGDNLQVRRRPYWERGVTDIRFVASELRSRGVASSDRLAVVGHSHGGDTVMLFAAQHPAEVRIAFSLDNRRMPLPRTRRPRICSARSSDQLADPGVLPTAREQAAHRMKITRLDRVRHDDMLDIAADDQKAAMIAALRLCLGTTSGQK